MMNETCKKIEDSHANHYTSAGFLGQHWSLVVNSHRFLKSCHRCQAPSAKAPLPVRRLWWAHHQRQDAVATGTHECEEPPTKKKHPQTMFFLVYIISTKKALKTSQKGSVQHLFANELNKTTQPKMIPRSTINGITPHFPIETFTQISFLWVFSLLHSQRHPTQPLWTSVRGTAV